MLQVQVYLDGTKVKRLRVFKGLTVRALAQRAGVSTSTVSLIESRKKHEGFHAPTLVKLARALEVEPSELIGEEDEA